MTSKSKLNCSIYVVLNMDKNHKMTILRFYFKQTKRLLITINLKVIIRNCIIKDDVITRIKIM